MQHSDKESRRVENGQLGRAGENLANTGTSGARPQYGPLKPGWDSIDRWYIEIKDYNFNNPGFVKGTGHFTQAIWASSLELGVGIASYQDNKGFNMDIVVANYFPPGNIKGHFVENVL